VFSDTLHAAEETIFGPATVTRSTGAPDTVEYKFALPEGFGPPYRLLIVNGDGRDALTLSSAVITLNGQQVLSPSDLNQKVSQVERPRFAGLHARHAGYAVGPEKDHSQMDRQWHSAGDSAGIGIPDSSRPSITSKAKPAMD